MSALLPKSSAARDSAAYHRKRELAKLRGNRLTAAAQEIGPLPAPRSLENRERSRNDLRFFAQTYFPKIFYLAWSEDHLRVIDKIERAVINHESFAVAMPRGSGKSSLCMVAVIWAVLTGRHSFVVLVASTGEFATRMLNNIKRQLTINTALAADYPEVLVPIQKLEGETRRCIGQRYYGVRTNIGWTAEEVILPTIPLSPASGAILRVTGIMGNIRGPVHVKSDGSMIRPSLVVVDDPQTDESARSPSQCAERLAIINGAIAGLSAPGSQTGIIIPCTVIRPGDLADVLLDRERNPQWQGERTKLVNAWPTDAQAWEEYRRVLLASGAKAATEFYRARREQMDLGGNAAWPARFDPSELSAIQHAYNLRIKWGEAAFFAEYQNEPILDADLANELTPAAIAAKFNRTPRGVVPPDATRITAFVDVQAALLYYAVVAWRENFTGYVLAYGSFPDQKRSYYTLRDATATLARAMKEAAGMEGQIFAGLDKLVNQLVAHEWTRQGDNAVMHIERLLIDANWGQSTDLVYQFCRQTPHSGLVMPSHGRYVGASTKPMHEWTKKPGEVVGLNWRVPPAAGRRAVRHVSFDANYWKSFIHARLSVAMGDVGCLSLYGDNADTHRMIADHLTAEYRVRTQGRGRVVDEWKLRPEKPDNHLFDCLAGCAVAASQLGCILPGTQDAEPRARRRYRLSDLQRLR